jgi:hypothetical protein
MSAWHISNNVRVSNGISKQDGFLGRSMPEYPKSEHSYGLASTDETVIARIIQANTERKKNDMAAPDRAVNLRE